MGSRRNTTADDLIDLIAMLPWYVGVAIALIAYVILSGIAASPTPTNPAHMVGHALAQFGRIVVPLLCLIGAAASAWRRHERRTLVDGVVGSADPASLDAMTWREFEKLVGEGFRLQGYSVVENEGAGPDGGVDLVLRKDGKKVLVQCKQWRSIKVGVPVVRELLGAMTALGANGGIVVTSGRFTPEALAFARGRELQLLDGRALHRLLQQARSSVAMAIPAQFEEPAFQARYKGAPACPSCSRVMVRRLAWKGTNAGKEFWGCPDFPRCRGTLSS